MITTHIALQSRKQVVDATGDIKQSVIETAECEWRSHEKAISASCPCPFTRQGRQGRYESVIECEQATSNETGTCPERGYCTVREDITSLCLQIVKLHNLQTYRASLLFLPDWYQNLRYIQYPRPDLL